MVQIWLRAPARLFFRAQSRKKAKPISVRIVHICDDFKPLNLAAKVYPPEAAPKATRERKEPLDRLGALSLSKRHKDGFDSLRSLRSLAANSVWLRLCHGVLLSICFVAACDDFDPDHLTAENARIAEIQIRCGLCALCVLCG